MQVQSNNFVSESNPNIMNSTDIWDDTKRRAGRPE